MRRNTDFLILGATGMQGVIVTRDLVESGYQVAISGRSQEKLLELQKKHPTVSAHPLDLSNEKEIYKLIETVRPNVVVNCAEGDWNLTVYKASLEGGSHVVDLGSEIPMTKDQLALDPEFKKKNLIGITGCGSTPGINNVMLDFASSDFDEIDTIEAGFAWNSNIKTFVVPFSMESILEEFSDAATALEEGKWVEKTPMKTVVDREFREVGLQKVFFVRHPEPYTFFFYFKNKGVKNIRYYAGFPEHSFDLIASFLPVRKVNGKKVTKVDNRQVLLTELTHELQKKYPIPVGYEEKENLWVIVEGKKDGKPHRVLMECIVPTLPEWKEAGCNIDTAFPMAIIAEMVRIGSINKPGSHAPEGAVPHYDFFQALNERGMSVWMNGTEIGHPRLTYSSGRKVSKNHNFLSLWLSKGLKWVSSR